MFDLGYRAIVCVRSTHRVSRRHRRDSRLPELGFVFIGLLDLSVSLGHPGELDHPDVDAIETVRASAVDAGVPSAVSVSGWTT